MVSGDNKRASRTDNNDPHLRTVASAILHQGDVGTVDRLGERSAAYLPAFDLAGNASATYW